jgi:tRNA(fMet)-specific endonuclease VapC
MKRMLDTNICSYFLRWHPPGMLERVSRLERAEVWLSTIVAAELGRKGKTIGNMDLLIAAHALAEDGVLVTNNARVFLRMPGLAVEEWSP